MSRILAIDPGSAAPGPACAMFSNGVLVRAWFDYRPVMNSVDFVIVENMQADARTRSINVSHLLACQFAGAFAAGIACAGGATIVSLTPTEWKGSEPKPVQHARLWAMLMPAECEVLGGTATADAIAMAVEKGACCRWTISGAECYPRSFRTHNLLDAAALGAYHLGRLAKR